MLMTVDKKDSSDEYIHNTISGEARKSGLGPSSFLEPLREEKTTQFSHSTSKVYSSTVQLFMVWDAKSQHPSRANHSRPWSHISSTLLKKIGLTHTIGTQMAQKNFKDMEEEVKNFIEIMCNMILITNLDDVTNMYQTLIPNRVAQIGHSKKGKKTIHVHTLITDTKCTTLATTMSRYGKVLIPTLIFRGR